MFRVVRAFAALLTLPVSMSFAQIQHTSESAQVRAAVPSWIAEAGGTKQFEVASVRQSVPGIPVTRPELLNPFDDTFPAPGLFRANAQLFTYIIYAYKLQNAQQFRDLAKQLPEWAQSDDFRIEARAEGSPTRDQIRLMLQSLLQERFQLRIHYEEKTGLVNNLVLIRPGSPGPHIKPHPQDVVCINRGAMPPPEGGNEKAPYCGMDVSQTSGKLFMKLTDVTMDEAAHYFGVVGGLLGGTGGAPVVNGTGLRGRFDLDFAFMKDQGLSESDPNAETGPTFTSALKDQLGVKLIKQTGTLLEFTVDHVERPSASAN